MTISTKFSEKVKVNIWRICGKPEGEDKKWKWRDVENPNHRAMYHGLLDAEPDHVSSCLSKTSHHNQLSSGQFAHKVEFWWIVSFLFFCCWITFPFTYWIWIQTYLRWFERGLSYLSTFQNWKKQIWKIYLRWFERG